MFNSSICRFFRLFIYEMWRLAWKNVLSPSMEEEEVEEEEDMLFVHARH